MYKKTEITIELHRIKHCLKAGAVVLDKFSTREEAENALEKKRSFYQFWADSATVSVLNTKPKIKKI
ncbi:hypothetical protein [Erwinia tasmaniensis]|uniref:Uncharacterized protein n=1 Tax=Erwinia tasmaniensis (strain DSM 17950 / CFBP 7177 / CIP 109463 / NCPPB 4357 / Et1/99) TaxID=465817 RepID=B2VAU4_ERWT9|nr:hypothetical protein [Erwinia tasmaniensis]CAO94898.1 Hypothetical protein ETA_pET490560 [Erwinia tasmaniensis Et1/99]